MLINPESPAKSSAGEINSYSTSNSEGNESFLHVKGLVEKKIQHLRMLRTTRKSEEGSAVEDSWKSQIYMLEKLKAFMDSKNNEKNRNII